MKLGSDGSDNLLVFRLVDANGKFKLVFGALDAKGCFAKTSGSIEFDGLEGGGQRRRHVFSSFVRLALTKVTDRTGHAIAALVSSASALCRASMRAAHRISPGASA